VIEARGLINRNEIKIIGSRPCQITQPCAAGLSSTAAFPPLRTDLKLAWAQMNLSDRPLEINRAEKCELLRIPGIGPKGVDAILRVRLKEKLRYLSSLRRLSINPERVAPFVLMDGKRAVQQLAIFKYRKLLTKNSRGWIVDVFLTKAENKSHLLQNGCYMFCFTNLMNII